MNNLFQPILCVDIGGTSTKAGLLYPNGKLKITGSIFSKPPVERFASELTQLIQQAVDSAREEGDALPVQVGVAVAGFLDTARTLLEYNSNLPWLQDFPLKQLVHNQFPSLAIELEVDSNAATMAEYHMGCGQGSKRFLCLTCGTGIGVGMTVSGAPLRFAYGCMGDIGHTIVQRGGLLCSCGGRGCAEVLCSATTLANRYASQIPSATDTTLRQVIEAAQSGSQVARDILREAGEWLGVAVASMANTFFPDQIAVAGGLSAAGDLVLAPAERMFRESASDVAKSMARFSQAKLGSTATLIGAAWPFWRENEV